MGTPPVLPDLTLLRRIGGGSYGDVWIARTITGVYRAVKVVDKARFADERPFLRELDGITRFQRSVGDQPRQLALMHVGRLEERGIFYYVMELADDVDAGTDINPDTYQPLTLKALHEKRPVLPASEVIRIGTELARSLLGLHTAGLIHRDVKPSNIIFVAGVPKLADIGLVSSSDHTLTSLGTPGYSPPEGAGTVRADLYSLGKILYQLATGRRTDDFPRLPGNVAERDDARTLLELNEIVLKACQPDPSLRYADAQSMLDELMLLHAGRSVKELNRARERLRQLGRAGLWLGAAAALVIAVLGVKNYFAVRALAAQEQQARIHAEQDERLARYTSDLNLAQLSLGSGDLGLTRAALRRHLPAPGTQDLRGLEWHALWSDAAGDETRVFGAVGGPSLRQSILAPDQDHILVLEVGPERSAVLLNLTDGTRTVLSTEVRDLGGFTADGASVILGKVDRTVSIVGIANGVARDLAHVSGRIQTPTTDGRSLLMGELVDGVVLLRLWDLAAETELARWSAASEPSGTGLSAVALSKDNRSLALALGWPSGAGRERELRVVDLVQGTQRFSRADMGRWQSLAFSQDGKQLAAGGTGQPVTVLDAETGATKFLGGTMPLQVFDVAFSPDGTKIAAASEDQTLRLWELSDGLSGMVLRGHEAGVLSVRWRNDQHVVTASDDGTVRIWGDTSSRHAKFAEGLWTGVLGDFIFEPGTAGILASMQDGTLGRFDARSLALTRRYEGFHPLHVTGRTVSGLSRDLELVDVNLDDGVVTPRGLCSGITARARIIAGSRDGAAAALGFSNGTVQVWDVAQGTSRTLATKHSLAILSVAFSPDGAQLASADEGGLICTWNVATGALMHSSHEDSVPVTSLGFSPTAPLLLVAGRYDGRLQVFSAGTLKLERELRVHNRELVAVEFTPAGDRLLTGGSDGFLVVWALPEFRQVAILQSPREVAGAPAAPVSYTRLRVAPDGSQLLGLTEDGRLIRWMLR